MVKGQKISVVSINNWADWEKELKNAFIVFLHSANYKFSLGSGSSYLVKQIIDAEKKLHGKSALEKEIQKIKKTPVCGVQITNGGNLPGLFQTPKDDSIKQYPNFNKIVHCVIPGPRITNFESKVKEMLSEAFSKITDAYKEQDKELFFVLPVIGINNFGYPVDFMFSLYVKLLKEWANSEQIKGHILIWVNESLVEKMRLMIGEEI